MVTNQNCIQRGINLPKACHHAIQTSLFSPMPSKIKGLKHKKILFYLSFFMSVKEFLAVRMTTNCEEGDGVGEKS
jgi:hypothetical protein